ncbi:hypothetical protein BH10PAT3_BH10PAT3_1270 [soil metagenome]
MANIEVFKAGILGASVLDPEGTHHEFVSGKHGQKLDFDVIPTGSLLYNEWVEVNVDFITDRHDEAEIIMGVANGTNRLALDVAARFKGRKLGLVSEKDPENSKILRLGSLARRVIKSFEPELVVVVEDVGTTGSNSVQVAEACLDAGAKDVIVVPTWMRQPRLDRLEDADILYDPIINETLATYTPDECRATGFCAQGWEYIPRPKQ